MRDENASKLFKVGDLVQYTPYYPDDTGPWQIFGDLGIVVKIREIEKNHQIVKVRWTSDNSELDMSSECLTKLNLPEKKLDKN